MNRTTFALFAMMLALPLLAQNNPEQKTRRDPWFGFDEGSWIVLHEKKTLSDKSTDNKVKVLLVKLEDNVPRLARIPELDGQFAEPKETFSNRPGGFPADSEIVARRKETLRVGEDKIGCGVVEYDIENKQSDFKAKLTVWRGGKAKLPYREIPTSAGNAPALLDDMVRAEYAYQYRGATVKYVVEVVDFAKSVKVGQRDLTCVLEKITFDETSKDKTFKGEGSRWLNSDVPGQEVRFQLKGSSNGVALEVERQVLDFKTSKKRS